MTQKFNHSQLIHSIKTRRGIQDLTEIINGKWKLPILITLFEKPYRFRELSRKLRISPRMLARELQDLEMNKLISRTVYDAKLTTVEYAITKTGRTLEKVLLAMGAWGISYRNEILSKDQ